MKIPRGTILATIALAGIGVGILVIRSEPFQRAINPAGYWPKEVEKLQANLEADRLVLRMVAIDLQRREANLPLDLAQDAVIAAGDAELAKTLREATIRMYRAGVDSLINQVRYLRAEIAHDDSALNYAREQVK